jgi:hypothetical protein
VPEAGQGKQIQREEVTDLRGALKIWTMSARVNDKYCSNPRVTWVAYGQKQVANGDDKECIDRRKRCLYNK